MGWIEDARAAVREATRNLPEEATVQERKKALRAAGSLFHGGTYWGRKKWGQAVREYLAGQGGPAIDPLKGKGADYGRLIDRMKSGDITFPFRKEGTDG